MRGSNIKKDLRLLGYEYYSKLEFSVVAGVKGDCLDRYLIRMNESLESCKAIQQCIKALIGQSFMNWGSKLRDLMEALIHSFKFVTEGYTLPKGQTYVRQEAPKGELGLLIVSDNTNKVYRVKIRSPDYYNLQALNIISHNHLLADLIPVLMLVVWYFGGFLTFISDVQTDSFMLASYCKLLALYCFILY